MNNIDMRKCQTALGRLVKSFILVQVCSASTLAFAVAVPGDKAPAFSEVDASGKVHNLEDYKGNWLVLEWFNKDCPYVGKHYGSSNMQGLQEKYTSKGVKWLSVVSSSVGKQGFLEPDEAELEYSSKNSHASAPFLLDVDGSMGKAFGAKTTPHMFVINPEGTVVYAGAIDDNDSSNPKVITSSHNYVAAALDSAMNDQPVEISSTKAYGCSVKY